MADVDLAPVELDDGDVISIGIGRGLTASPLPHHRTFGSRIRRFGRLSQGGVYTPTGASSPARQCASPVGCIHSVRNDSSLTSSRRTVRAFGPLHCGRLLVRPCGPLWCLCLPLLCPLLTSTGRSGRIAPPAVLGEDTPQISRGQLSDRPCIGARFIKHRPVVDGGLCCRVPARPNGTTPRIGFVSLAPHVRSTRPADPTSR